MKSLAGLIAVAATVAALLFAAMALWALISQNPHRRLPIQTEEAWDSRLAGVTSIDAAVAELPNYMAKDAPANQRAIVDAINSFVEQRFVHGTSQISFSESWFTWLASSLLPDLDVPVGPNDILSHRHAMCSQQSLVFMALLKRFGIQYAAVRFAWPDLDRASSGHFAVAAKVDGVWRYYDTDFEIRPNGLPIDQALTPQALASAYAQHPQVVSRMLHALATKQVTVSDFNRNPAPRGYLFQKMAEWLSHYGALLFCAIAVIALRLNRPIVRRLPAVV